MRLGKLTIVIAEDSPTHRLILKRVMRQFENAEIVGVATNGREAIDLVVKHEPDIALIDLDLPVIDGEAVIRELVRTKSAGKIVALATEGDPGATRRASAAGAVAACPKTFGTSGLDSFIDDLRQAIGASRPRHVRKPAVASDACSLVVVASSTGGPRTLETVLGKLQPGRGRAYVVAQHLPAGFSQTLAANLGRRCPIPVREVRGGDIIKPDQVFIAPSGSNLRLQLRTNGQITARVSKGDDAMACPSADHPSIKS